MGQTKTTRSISATGLFLLIMMTVGLYSCTRTQKDIIPSADYAPYVNAYTGGVISQNSTIRIELTHRPTGKWNRDCFLRSLIHYSRFKRTD